MSTKVALITGGASGMGLAVSQSLAARGWKLAILDRNPTPTGEQTQTTGKSDSIFIEVDVSDFKALGNAFVRAWEHYGRLDFVFANAGIIDRQSFYAVQQSDSAGLPPPLNMDVLKVDLDAVISTCYLAQHFFRKNKNKNTNSAAGGDDVGGGGGGSIIITASIGSFYPTADLPLYSAAKHGCVGFMRSIAGRLMKEKIRVNCICPSSVKTSLLSQDAWDAFPTELDTPISKIVEVVNLVLDDDTMYGQAIEIMMQDHQSRDPIPFGNEKIKAIWEVENQV
ncbi:hypothetical protein A1O3_09342 [Capronia epimyces CBS 606.96]|uniref:15-hydroxyprostaglandin dehydrogenase (NAD) n=1 Tax=Capronia epimyces CBS 606.96 TaxID=1182542 RepID=W9XMH6_9EURO|nr:uncharacterized protein A1O3_09342 [Capronia epimyces CBS 606.96]EXJ78181.1 hypothetical protein A1O3_09342 [Capronia epimyces CBS 606.96]